jgi:GNAT superfamily N-acetyltransferase
VQERVSEPEVRPVEGKRQFRQFIDYHYDRNRADPHFIPELRLGEIEKLTPRKNPFFAHADVQLYLAWRDGRVVGRIAAIDDRLHNEAHGDNLVMFGFFDADDALVSRALLGEVEAWARAKGRAAVRGPLNPSLNETAGLLIDGFDTDPMLMMPRNPRDYAAFIESCGYGKVKDLYAWIYDLSLDVPDVIQRMAERVKREGGITARPFNLKEFANETERLREIYCGAWERNWGFVPPTEAEFKRIATEMKPIFDPNAAVLAEKDGRPIACAVALPDVNQALRGTEGKLFPFGLIKLLRRKKYIDQMRLLLLGVLPEYRATGIFALLIVELGRLVRAKTRYKRVEFSWVLEDNHAINQTVERIGAVRYQTYRIYQKAIA